MPDEVTGRPIESADIESADIESSGEQEAADQSAADRSVRSRLFWRLFTFGLAALALYVVLPGLTEVLQAWPRLAEIAPGWFAVMLAAELASFGCVWMLQRFVFVGARWFPLITSQLASNAFSRVVPGGAAAGGVAIGAPV